MFDKNQSFEKSAHIGFALAGLKVAHGGAWLNIVQPAQEHDGGFEQAQSICISNEGLRTLVALLADAGLCEVSA